jgi:hypothetical protein
MQRLPIKLLAGLVATKFIVGRCTASAIASAAGNDAPRKRKNKVVHRFKTLAALRPDR